MWAIILGTLEFQVGGNSTSWLDRYVSQGVSYGVVSALTTVFLGAFYDCRQIRWLPEIESMAHVP